MILLCSLPSTGQASPAVAAKAGVAPSDPNPGPVMATEAETLVQAGSASAAEGCPDQAVASSPPRVAVADPGTGADPAPTSGPAAAAELPAAATPPVPSREEGSSARGPHPLDDLAQVVTGVLPDLLRRAQEVWGRQSEEQEHLQRLAATLAERERALAERERAAADSFNEAERTLRKAREDAAAAAKLRDQVGRAEEAARKRTEELASWTERLRREEEVLQTSQALARR